MAHLWEATQKLGLHHKKWGPQILKTKQNTHTHTHTHTPSLNLKTQQEPNPGRA
jgi:hypothetical protein